MRNNYRQDRRETRAQKYNVLTQKAERRL